MTYAADPAAIQGAVSAGLLGCGSVILGASQVAGALLIEVATAAKQGETLDEAALRILARLKAEGSTVPGFGHSIHRDGDPRAVRLLAVAEELGVSGEHCAAAKALERHVATVTGRNLPMNVSAGIPALLLDAGYPADSLKGIPLLARCAALIAHLREESRTRLMPPQELVPPLEVLRAFRGHDFTLTDFLASRVEKMPDAEFIGFEGSTLAYREFSREVSRTASWLRGKNVAAGDRICVMAPNHPAIAILMFATARIGAIMVPMNPAYGVAEARHVLGHSEPVGLLTAPATVAVMKQALAEAGIPAWIVMTEAGDGGPALAAAVGEIDVPDDDRPPPSDPDDVCLIIYTSGTTGFPKGVMHSQRTIVLTGESFVGRMYLQPGERMLCVLPMFHINALMYSLAGAMACGGTFLPVRAFSASSFWRIAAETRATEVNFVGAMAHILAIRPRTEYDPGHSIWRAFAAPVTQPVIDAFRGDFGIDPLIECYGMSEIPGVLANPFLGPRKTACLGVISPHPDQSVERPRLRIVDDAGKDVAPGRSGELVARTPTLMLGYFRAPEETAAAFREGWFLTGDIVQQDADGYYFFVARRKDIIRRRGENISGAELDQALMAHPGIAEAAAIPVPSELGDDDILQHWMRDTLSALKMPRYVAFLDALPRTPTQRVEKYKLRQDEALRRQAIDLSVPS